MYIEHWLKGNRDKEVTVETLLNWQNSYDGEKIDYLNEVSEAISDQYSAIVLFLLAMVFAILPAIIFFVGGNIASLLFATISFGFFYLGVNYCQNKKDHLSPDTVELLRAYSFLEDSEIFKLEEVNAFETCGDAVYFRNASIIELLYWAQSIKVLQHKEGETDSVVQRKKWGQEHRRQIRLYRVPKEVNFYFGEGELVREEKPKLKT